MKETSKIDIDLDKSCRRCDRKGATQSGLCLECITELVQQGALDHILRRRPTRDQDAEQDGAVTPPAQSVEQVAEPDGLDKAHPRTIELSQEEFDNLLEYSMTLPTGTIVGKRWKRHILSTERWVMGEYIEDPEPGIVGIRWTDIVVTNPPAG